MNPTGFAYAYPDHRLECEETWEPALIAAVAQVRAAKPGPKTHSDQDDLPVGVVFTSGLLALCGSIAAVGILTALLLLATRAMPVALRTLAQVMY